MKTEKILVVPRAGRLSEYLKHGCFPFHKSDLEHVSFDAVYGTRYLMEDNTNFKQFIPYVAIINDKKVFVYKRGKAGAENKLHDLYSIGVGGHVDLEDDEMKSAYDVTMDAARREVKEEIDLDISREELTLEYAINDDSEESDAVGKVHFGLCFVVNGHFDMDKGEMEHLEERVFMSRAEMEEIYDSLETWSKLFYDAVIKNLID